MSEGPFDDILVNGKNNTTLITNSIPLLDGRSIDNKGTNIPLETYKFVYSIPKLFGELDNNGNKELNKERHLPMSPYFFKNINRQNVLTSDDKVTLLTEFVKGKEIINKLIESNILNNKQTTIINEIKKDVGSVSADFEPTMKTVIGEFEKLRKKWKNDAIASLQVAYVKYKHARYSKDENAKKSADKKAGDDDMEKMKNEFKNYGQTMITSDTIWEDFVDLLSNDAIYNNYKSDKKYITISEVKYGRLPSLTSEQKETIKDIFDFDKNKNDENIHFYPYGKDDESTPITLGHRFKILNIRYLWEYCKDLVTSPDEGNSIENKFKEWRKLMGFYSNDERDIRLNKVGSIIGNFLRKNADVIRIDDCTQDYLENKYKDAIWRTYAGPIFAITGIIVFYRIFTTILDLLKDTEDGTVLVNKIKSNSFTLLDKIFHYTDIDDEEKKRKEIFAVSSILSPHPFLHNKMKSFWYWSWLNKKNHDDELPYNTENKPPYYDVGPKKSIYFEENNDISLPDIFKYGVCVVMGTTFSLFENGMMNYIRKHDSYIKNKNNEIINKENEEIGWWKYLLIFVKLFLVTNGSLLIQSSIVILFLISLYAFKNFFGYWIIVGIMVSFLFIIIYDFFKIWQKKKKYRVKFTIIVFLLTVCTGALSSICHFILSPVKLDSVFDINIWQLVIPLSVIFVTTLGTILYGVNHYVNRCLPPDGDVEVDPDVKKTANIIKKFKSIMLVIVSPILLDYFILKFDKDKLDDVTLWSLLKPLPYAFLGSFALIFGVWFGIIGSVLLYLRIFLGIGSSNNSEAITGNDFAGKMIKRVRSFVSLWILLCVLMLLGNVIQNNKSVKAGNKNQANIKLWEENLISEVPHAAHKIPRFKYNVLFKGFDKHIEFDVDKFKEETNNRIEKLEEDIKDLDTDDKDYKVKKRQKEVEKKALEIALNQHTGANSQCLGSYVKKFVPGPFMVLGIVILFYGLNNTISKEDTPNTASNEDTSDIVDKSKDIKKNLQEKMNKIMEKYSARDSAKNNSLYTMILNFSFIVITLLIIVIWSYEYLPEFLNIQRKYKDARDDMDMDMPDNSVLMKLGIFFGGVLAIIISLFVMWYMRNKEKKNLAAKTAKESSSAIDNE